MLHRRFCHMALIVICAVLTPLTPAYSFKSEVDPVLIAECERTPDCVDWLAYHVALKEFYDALLLGAFYTALTQPVQLGDCGGDLPPCSVRERESGGNYQAVNPNGCGGDGCYGAWQFKQTTWDAVAERMGRVDLIGVRASTVDPLTQDDLARNLWAGGAGASNWSETL